jgi:hypothetical protein
VKSGNLTVGPLAGTVVVYGGPQDFFGRYRQRSQVDFASVPQRLQVASVPLENASQLHRRGRQLHDERQHVGPTNVATGDPITVRVQISGRGALDG